MAQLINDDLSTIGGILDSLKDLPEDAECTPFGDPTVTLLYDDKKNVAYLDSAKFFKEEGIEGTECGSGFQTVKELTDALKKIPANTPCTPYGDWRSCIVFDKDSNFVYLENKDFLLEEILDDPER